jgi:hypothetical protein
MPPAGGGARAERGGPVRARVRQVPPAGLRGAAVPRLAPAHGARDRRRQRLRRRRARTAAGCSSTRAPGRRARVGLAPAVRASTASSSRTSRRSTRAASRDAMSSRFGVSRRVHSLGRRGAAGQADGGGRDRSAGPSRSRRSGHPGHCAMHNCYHVRSTAVPSARSLLISGDLVFAGSAGGPYHCHRSSAPTCAGCLAAVPRTRWSRRATAR